MQLGNSTLQYCVFFSLSACWKLDDVCRAVDEMDKQILQHTSLKSLYFYRQQVTAVSMLAGLEGISPPSFLALMSQNVLTFDSCITSGVPSYHVRIGEPSSALLCLAELGLQFH